MRKSYFTYLAASFMAFCLATSAADQASAEETQKKNKYNKMIDESLELPKYDEKITSPAVSAEINQTGNSGLCALPSEVLVNVFTLLDTQSLLLVSALTCQQFHIISKAPILYLNAQKLTPYMHCAMPLWLLKNKVNNTKGGVYLIADDKSVSQQTLIEIVGKDRLEKEATKITIPTTLENQSEEQLTDLYPRFKVALAAGHQTEALLSLINADYGRTYPQDQPRSTTLLYLYTLLPTNQPLHTWGLQNLFNALPTDPNAHQDHQPKGIIARKLLEAEKWIGIVSSIYYFNFINKEDSHPPLSKEGLCHNLAKWILENSSDLTEISSTLFACANLRLSTLVATATEKLLKLPCSPEKLPTKLSALIKYCQHTYGKGGDSDIMDQIMLIAKNNASNEQWEPLTQRTKIRVLSLLAYTRPIVFNTQSKSFLASKPNLAEINDSLFLEYLDCIHQCNYETQHKEWTNYYLNYDLDVLMIQGNNSLLSFIHEHAMPADRAKALSLIKANIERPKTTDQYKLNLLNYFSSLPEKDKDFIERHLSSLNARNLDPSYPISYGMIYGSIGIDELFNHYYLISIDGLILIQGNHHPGTLEYFSKKGIKLDSLSELKQKDPRLILDILQQANYSVKNGKDSRRYSINTSE